MVKYWYWAILLFILKSFWTLILWTNKVFIYESKLTILPKHRYFFGALSDQNFGTVEKNELIKVFRRGSEFIWFSDPNVSEGNVASVTSSVFLSVKITNATI